MMTTAERHRLAFDPIQEAARQWSTHWGEMPRMRAVTSLMRVHQLVLTGKIGERLQVHATSVTPLVKRLEAAELIRRTPHPEDGRAVLASITPKGRLVMEKATEAIVGARFGLSALTDEECDQLTWLLTQPREAAGDF